MNLFLRPILFFALVAAFSSMGSVRTLAEENAPPARNKDVTIEEFLQSLSSVQGVVVRRDPFQEAPPPYSVPGPAVAAVEVEDNNGPVAGAPLLERYAVSEYEVVAVLLGDQYPRALLRLPKDNGPGGQKVVIVKEKDKLGNRQGAIVRITLEGIVVQQIQRLRHGFVDKAEVLLRVGGSSANQKQSLQSVKSTAKDGNEPKAHK